MTTKVLFNRFVVTAEFSKELWYTDSKDGARMYHLLNISIVERQMDDGMYSGLQLNLAGLGICIGDALTARRTNQ